LLSSSFFWYLEFYSGFVFCCGLAAFEEREEANAYI
jgi:hypothetical protein